MSFLVKHPDFEEEFTFALGIVTLLQDPPASSRIAT